MGLAPLLLFFGNSKSIGGTPDEITACDHVQKSPGEKVSAARYALQALRRQDLHIELSQGPSRSSRRKKSLNQEYFKEKPEYFTHCAAIIRSRWRSTPLIATCANSKRCWRSVRTAIGGCLAMVRSWRHCRARDASINCVAKTSLPQR
jgi:hypothetical protein